MSLTLPPGQPDPTGAIDPETGEPSATVDAAHWQIDLVQIGGTTELAKDSPDLSAITGRVAATVHRDLAAAQSGALRLATEEYRFGDGVIATFAEALAAGMDPSHPDHALHLKLLQAQTLIKEWVEAQVVRNQHPGATINA